MFLLIKKPHRHFYAQRKENLVFRRYFLPNSPEMNSNLFEKNEIKNNFHQTVTEPLPLMLRKLYSTRKNLQMLMPIKMYTRSKIGPLELS